MFKGACTCSRSPKSTFLGTGRKQKTRPSSSWHQTSAASCSCMSGTAKHTRERKPCWVSVNRWYFLSICFSSLHRTSSCVDTAVPRPELPQVTMLGRFVSPARAKETEKTVWRTGSDPSAASRDIEISCTFCRKRSHWKASAWNCWDNAATISSDTTILLISLFAADSLVRNGMRISVPLKGLDDSWQVRWGPWYEEKATALLIKDSWAGFEQGDKNG